MPAFPVWLSWLLLIAVIVGWIWVAMLAGRVAQLAGPAVPHSRTELENMYTAGTINRDQYERMKARVK